jgi:HSP20 family protein
MSLIRYQAPSSFAMPTLGRLSNLRDELDSLFELPFLSNIANQTQLFSGWTPALDLYQTNDNVIAIVELPGMQKEDIEISLHEGMLTISGERKQQNSENEKAERSERYVGKFRRSITLPTRVDASKVNATYKDGILSVTLPKAEEAKPRKIQVNVA